jgi:hypothetical protein
VNDEREASLSPDPRDPLDHLLAQARWPQASTESTSRLRQQWLALRASQNRWRQILAPLSAAAIVALAIGLAWFAQRKPHGPAVLSTTTRPRDDRAVQSAMLVGRKPTVLESMMIRAAEAREKKRKSASQPSALVARPVANARSMRTSSQRAVMPPVLVERAATRPATSPPLRDPIASLLQSRDAAAIDQYLDLVANPNSRNQALVALSQSPAPPTEQMLAALKAPVVERRVAAALVLGRIDGPVLTRRLIQMVAADQNRREALIALASSRGKDARAFVERAAQSSEFAGLARSTLAMNEVRQTEVQ